MRFTTVIGVLLGFVFFGAGRSRGQRNFPNINIQDLKAAIDKKDVVIIDANGTDSFKNGHIPGAIDFEANGANLAKLLPSDKSAWSSPTAADPSAMPIRPPPQRPPNWATPT